MTQQAIPKNAIALLSDVDKTSYNEKIYGNISFTMYERICSKISGKSGNAIKLMLYLVLQQQNGAFKPAESTICAACHFGHSEYVRARQALVQLGLIEYKEFQYIKILYKNFMNS